MLILVTPPPWADIAVRNVAVSSMPIRLPIMQRLSDMGTLSCLLRAHILPTLSRELQITGVNHRSLSTQVEPVSAL
jgi:hypothetical protein